MSVVAVITERRVKLQALLLFIGDDFFFVKEGNHVFHNVFDFLLSLLAVAVHFITDFNQEAVDHVDRSVNIQHIFDVVLGLYEEGVLIA